jgi:hypothetical protein
MSKEFFTIDTIWVLLGGVASIITIFGLFKFIKRRRNINNNLKKTKIGGNYTGGNKSHQDDEIKIKNTLNDVEIEKDYTGGNSD